MIVSIAIAVLPMARSPMISSRWPRPIGIIESIALIPVWSGSFTGCRLMMPGATMSTLRVFVPWSGPIPSRGRNGPAPRHEDPQSGHRRARHHQAAAGEGAAPDGDQGDRLDDPDRPRPARADH